MNNFKPLIFRIISLTFIAGTLIATGIFANEARKEVIFLCGNFKIGILKKDLVRQLETGTFLHYTQEINERETVVKMSSRFTFNQLYCDVYFDANNRVTHVYRSY
jgi:hypothetical protein